MDTSRLGEYVTFGVLLLVGFAFVAVAMTANRILRPSAPSAAKGAAYECGVDPVGKDWAQVQIRYYVYAFLFVLFAVEAVFLFPWAAVFRAFGAAAAVEMGLFVGVLALGLAYAWRKGVLRWR
ncbi:NADH-quinone oxidoreductase subunit A [Glycomyces albidus]|jgi:NADH-quinone oxidoreductase subunit A|uniref:NADH-quinone oxidoreductase subunit A n=1 Tax=Glycomyces albidus TaxID=2656774 RepID=A0A6L5G641_9ACTN|nr:NADH-quinone oxidoreductase subunit A [Glycomyces albidus]MQM25114.1 NADH-quinone oxidoreductase subunit A [Glycomyces albidus]